MGGKNTKEPLNIPTTSDKDYVRCVSWEQQLDTILSQVQLRYVL